MVESGTGTEAHPDFGAPPSREPGITAATISGWRDEFLDAGQAAPKSRPTDDRDEEIAVLGLWDRHSTQNRVGPVSAGDSEQTVK